jgi:hypothetical protein
MHFGEIQPYGKKSAFFDPESLPLDIVDLPPLFKGQSG